MSLAQGYNSNKIGNRCEKRHDVPLTSLEVHNPQSAHWFPHKSIKYFYSGLWTEQPMRRICCSPYRAHISIRTAPPPQHASLSPIFCPQTPTPLISPSISTSTLGPNYSLPPLERYRTIAKSMTPLVTTILLFIIDALTGVAGSQTDQKIKKSCREWRWA
jgi:hypothetical protein